MIGAAEGGSDAEAAIRAEIQAALDAGRSPDFDGLHQRFPRQRTLIERLAEDARDYVLRLSILRGPGQLPPLRPGDRLGPFVIEDYLAHGGMGYVFRARQDRLDRVVALKVIDARAWNDSFVARFRREAQHLAGLSHPNLAEVYDAGQEGHLLYYAMRLIEGPSLARVLDGLVEERIGQEALGRRPGRTEARRREQQRRQIVQWCADIAAALAYVHENEVLHRDVKPGNIVIEVDSRRLPDRALTGLPPGRAVLVDFGLARNLNGKTVVAGTEAMTPEYAAPEIVLGQDIKASADVFSMGVTMYDLLAAVRPADRGRPGAGLPSLRATGRGVDAGLAAIVSMAHDPDSALRYASGSALHEDLQAWLDGGPIAARDPPLLLRMRRELAARPGPFVRRTLGVLVATTLLVLGLVSALRARDAAALAARESRLGHPLAVADALRRVPQFLAPALLDDSLEPLRAELDGGRDGGAFPRVAERLRFGDGEGALYEAVTELRRDGLKPHPLFVNFLVDELQGSGGASERSVERRHHAILLVARLFYERPDASLDESLASEPVRVALRRYRHASELTPDEQLYLTTALSGCGTMEDVPILLAEAFAQPVQSEQLRVALLAAERCVRRAHGAGGFERPDLEANWTSFLDWAGHYRFPVAGTSDPLCHRVRTAVFVTARAIVLALRASGARHGVEPLLPEDLEAREPAEIGSPGEITHLLAAAADARLFPALADREARPGSQNDAWYWGQACGLVGDADVVRRARERCLEFVQQAAGPGGLLEAFDEGVIHGDRERRGEIADVLLDGDTLLGTEPGGVETVWQNDPATKPLEPETSDVDSRGDVIAMWSFQSDPPALMGGALVARSRHVSLRREYPEARTFLRFAPSEPAEVSLAFRVDQATALGWRLAIYCQLGSRMYYPHQGQALVRVELDGERLTLGQALLGDAGYWLDFDFSGDRLAPGEHEVRVHLDRSTNATFRLHVVKLERVLPTGR